MTTAFRISRRTPQLALAALLMTSLAVALSAVTVPGHAADFGTRTPSVNDIISNLQSSEASAVDGVRTRALRPGAASQATAQPAVQAAPIETAASSPRTGAISMQIQFDFGSDRIAQASVPTMDNLTQALRSKDLQERSFTVVGHTDGAGSADYNQRLSQRRASAVKAYLVRGGVESNRVKTQGKGFEELLDPAHPRAAENRRVEVIAGG